MSDQPKYLADGHAWACLGCGYALYPDAKETDYCANVRCSLHARHSSNADNVRRLVERCVSLERELAEARLENERGEYEENQELRIRLTRSEARCKRLEKELRAVATCTEPGCYDCRVNARASLATDGDSDAPK